eukprot:gene553-1210_t
MADENRSEEKKFIAVYGCLSAVSFQQAKVAAEAIVSKRKDVFSASKAVGMLECDWKHFVEETKKIKQGETWGFDDETLVFLDDKPFGPADYFIAWLKTTYQYEEFRPLPLFYAMAKEEYKGQLVDKKNDFVFFELSIGGDPIGRLMMELFSNQCPKTCENFKQLCIGDKVAKDDNGMPLPLTYQNSIFHRIVPNGWIQGGDIAGGRGNNGQSIYGPTFEDENFSVLHNQRGIIGMANKGRHTNGSQFYIILQPAQWMNTHYVAFGRVIEGSNVLKKLEEQETYNERPVRECRITRCGLIDLDALYKV